MARPSKQGERREEIRQAAARAIISGSGQPPLRLTDVAREAGMTPAAILYYYADVDELLRECARHAMTRYTDDRLRHLESHTDPTQQLAAVLAESLPQGPDDPDWVLYFADASSGRDPARAVVSCAIFDASVEIYRQILHRGAEMGVFHLIDSPLAIARTLGALEDGLAIYIVNRHPVIDRIEATQMVLRYVQAATGVDLSSVDLKALSEQPV